jgi:D-alanyl-D-alanine dipeptidase
VVFADGRGPGGAVLRPETLAEMLTPQFAEAGARTGFGLGFAIGELAGRPTFGHGGAIYGFATQLQFLKDEELGVVVCANLDLVNSVTERIARQALEWLLAVREGHALAPASLPAPVGSELARRLAGRYVRGDDLLELVEREGELSAQHGRVRVPVRSHGGSLKLDGRLALGPVLSDLGPDQVRLGDALYRRVPRDRPAPAPERWRGLIGEYGWDHNVLFVFEQDQALHVLIEWFEIDRLSELAPDEFAFPAEGGLYPLERLVFRRDARGRASAVEAAGVVFPRRALRGEEARNFTIEPVRPVEELRREALAARPPAEPGEFLESDLVELGSLDPSIRLDLRYAGADNFLQTPCYESAHAFLQRPAAEALVRAQRALAGQGYGLLVHDAYRPWYVTRIFWEATPPAQRLFVADPAQGSRHNRGCAVDLTLFELATGQPVEMVALYDEMSERSYPDYVGGTSLQRWHRELLRQALEDQGFRVYPHEWWHFDFLGWERYRIENATFEELARAGRRPGSG